MVRSQEDSYILIFNNEQLCYNFNRGVNMKNKIFIVFLLTMLFILPGCNSLEFVEKATKQEEKVDKKYFYTYEDNFKVKVPSTWEEAKEGDLNSDADMELEGKKIEKYFMILAENKVNFDSFEFWYDIVLRSNADSYNFESDIVKDTKINGYDTKYAEFDTSFNGVRIYMRIYFIQSENYYSQVFMWSTMDQKEKLQDEFDEIINSFEEVVEVNNA